MFSIAYSFRYNSIDDPLLIHMETFVAAIIQALLPTKFLVVSLVLVYAPDKSSNIRHPLECISGFEASSFLDAWWFF
jgi:hypothetical protein